jgi:hypothetical protein
MTGAEALLADRALFEAEVFQNREAEPSIVRFDTLNLQFPSTNTWTGAQWRMSVGQSMTCFPAEEVAEIASSSGCFVVRVIDGDGICIGEFSVQTALSGFPSHSFCFLFRIDQDGMWSGHTLTRSFGRLVVAPHRFDPT